MSDLKFSIKDTLDIAKDNQELKEILTKYFNSESGGTGLYFAMAKVAQYTGYPEIAEVLKSMGLEEAEHAAQYAILSGKVSGDIKIDIEKMMRSEAGVSKPLGELAEKAEASGLSELAAIVKNAYKDEAKHACMLEGLLKRL